MNKKQAFALGQLLAMRKRADDLTPIQQSMAGLAAAWQDWQENSCH